MAKTVAEQREESDLAWNKTLTDFWDYIKRDKNMRYHWNNENRVYGDLCANISPKGFIT